MNLNINQTLNKSAPKRAREEARFKALKFTSKPFRLAVNFQRYHFILLLDEKDGFYLFRRLGTTLNIYFRNTRQLFNYNLQALQQAVNFLNIHPDIGVMVALQPLLNCSGLNPEFNMQLIQHHANLLRAVQMSNIIVQNYMYNYLAILQQYCNQLGQVLPLMNVLNQVAANGIYQASLVLHQQNEGETLKNKLLKAGPTNFMIESIRLYTAETFLYKKVNRCMREANMNELYSNRISEMSALTNLLLPYCMALQFGLYFQGVIQFWKAGGNRGDFPRNVYRGCHLSEEQKNEFRKNIGQIIVFESFLSTTTNYYVARQFSGNGPPEARCILHIDVPDKSQTLAVNVKSMSVNSDEDEILFPYCSTFMILSVKSYDGITWISLQSSNESWLDFLNRKFPF